MLGPAEMEIDFNPFDFVKYKSKKKIEDEINKLIIYNERDAGPRFANIGKLDDARNDEQILAHIGLIWKDMLKSCLEGFYGYQLDDENFYKQIKSMSADKYGGVNYYNYQFSDAYDDEDRCTDRPLNKTDMKYYAKLSVSDALSKYGMLDLGGLIITPEMLAYVKKWRALGKIPDSHVHRDEAAYKRMYEAAQRMITLQPNLQGHPIMCLAGGFHGECGWEFGQVRYSQKEVNDHGWADAGESWIGFTHWNTKYQCAKKAGVNVPLSQGEYAARAAELEAMGLRDRAPLTEFQGYTPNLICTCSFDDTMKLLEAYASRTKCAPKWIWGWPTVYNEPGAANECMASSYMFKHGENRCLHLPTVWERAVACTNSPIQTWIGAITNRNPFALHVYVSMCFAYYVAYGKVPKGDPWLPPK